MANTTYHLNCESQEVRDHAKALVNAQADLVDITGKIKAEVDELAKTNSANAVDRLVEFGTNSANDSKSVQVPVEEVAKALTEMADIADAAQDI